MKGIAAWLQGTSSTPVPDVCTLSHSKIFELILLYPKQNCNVALGKSKYVSWNAIVDRLSWAKRLMFFVGLTTKQLTLADISIQFAYINNTVQEDSVNNFSWFY